jgi:hypothetical protein
MKILKFFKSAIDKFEPSKITSSSVFSRLDSEKLKTHLRLRERAESRGAQNSPAENEVDLNDKLSPLLRMKKMRQLPHTITTIIHTKIE